MGGGGAIEAERRRGRGGKKKGGRGCLTAVFAARESKASDTAVEGGAGCAGCVGGAACFDSTNACMVFTVISIKKDDVCIDLSWRLYWSVFQLALVCI